MRMGWIRQFQQVHEKSLAIGLCVNYWEINQVTSKSQMDFLDKIFKKRSKIKKVNTTFEFYIFQVV